MSWIRNDLVSLKLRDGLFTIAQMLASPVMQFYGMSNSDGDWNGVDLNLTDPLFRVFVGKVVVKKMAEEKLDKKIAIPRVDCGNYKFIKPYTLGMDGDHYKGGRNSFPFLGGKLIDLGPDGDIGVTLAPVLRDDLALPDDREIIERYELTNMWGDEDLTDRLIRYFETGINRDDLKFEVFPGLWDDRESLRPLTRRLPVPRR
ncbi:hypothetical protein [Burkholderia alba]|uniref:hypothetical protein n=1 Tax=Burkholderia alba TaxID=2683677 RepID=UPI002B056594|nr:hypothetical protein [Burkholderia alba]